MSKEMQPKKFQTPEFKGAVRNEDGEILEINALEQLMYLRDTYSDKIPTQIVRSTDVNNRYKVRKVWWSLLFNALETGILENQIDKKHYLEIFSFMDYHLMLSKYQKSKFDIEQANKLINKIVKEDDSDPMLWTDPTVKLYDPKWFNIEEVA